MEDCLFCKIIKGEIPCQKVYEDDMFFAFLDIHPINLGHTLLMPKNHHRNLFDLPTNILEKTGPLIKKIALAVREASCADGINIGWNNETAAGQVIFHSHIHIIPRFNNDGFTHWKGQEHSENALTEMKDKIEQQIKLIN
jgi:histidine triad (HIT) family protein